MRFHQETPDVDFFALVHHLLDGAPSASVERRRADRRDFTCVQFIAPYVDGRLPKETDFRPIRCQDLSSSGFSYLAANVPVNEFQIVALGAAPHIFLSARVVHHAPQATPEGEPMFLIGCRFVARISGTAYGRHLGPQ